MRYHDNWRAQRFYRDPQHGIIMGVCAGIADYFGWSRMIVRVFAVLALVWFNVITLIVYFALGFLLPPKPQQLHDWDTDETYWRSVRRSANDTFRGVRQRLRELDTTLQRMERYVTSSRYDLERKFRDLER